MQSGRDQSGASLGADGKPQLRTAHPRSIRQVDIKVRASRANPSEQAPLIVGWDVSGEVVELGSDVRHFKVGDEVYASGDVSRQGCFAGASTVLWW